MTSAAGKNQMRYGRIRLLLSVISVASLCTLLTFALVTRAEDSEQDEAVTAVGEKKKPVVHLYFGDMDQTYLTAEEWELVKSDSPSQLGYRILEALISGPRGAHVRTIPEKTEIRAFYLTDQGTAYVDLTGGIRENHPGGINAEMFTIFSIVNSLVLNVKEINTVKILIDGNEVRTLAGHMDLKTPLRAEMRLIR